MPSPVQSVVRVTAVNAAHVVAAVAVVTVKTVLPAVIAWTNRVPICANPLPKPTPAVPAGLNESRVLNANPGPSASRARTAKRALTVSPVP